VNASRLRFGRLEIRPRERRLLLDDREVPVGARAFDLLLVLVEERERLVPKQELLERVWPKLVVEEANLSVHVAALRKALGTDIIATIPGRGYRFALAEETDPAAEAMSALSAADAVARSAAVASEPRSGAGHGYVAAGDALFVGREDEVYDCWPNAGWSRSLAKAESGRHAWREPCGSASGRTSSTVPGGSIWPPQRARRRWQEPSHARWASCSPSTNRRAAWRRRWPCVHACWSCSTTASRRRRRRPPWWPNCWQACRRSGFWGLRACRCM
jgi:DNA-binding winged helix-turn-helix (wHTH) protein